VLAASLRARTNPLTARGVDHVWALAASTALAFDWRMVRKSMADT
jgi:hypothetical protein